MNWRVVFSDADQADLTAIQGYISERAGLPLGSVSSKASSPITSILRRCPNGALGVMTSVPVFARLDIDGARRSSSTSTMHNTAWRSTAFSMQVVSLKGTA
jgi:hypothetical protein